MKRMRKLAGIVLAMVMVLSMSLTAFAQEVDSEQNGAAKITISNAAKGETYSIVKLFDASVTGEEDGSIVYTGTIPEALNDYFETVAGGYVKAKAAAIAEDDSLSEAAVAAMKEWAATQTAVASAVSDGSELTFTNLPYGYYVVTTTQGTAITVDSTNPDVTVYDKNSKEPTIAKTVDDTDVYIGQTVTYTATSNTANYLGEGAAAEIVTKYEISDTLPGFLTDVTVTSIIIDQDADSATTEEQIALEVKQFDDNNVITIDWIDENNNSLYANGSQIIITYTAKVTDQAVVDGTEGNKNEVTLQPYTDDNPDDDKEPEPWEESWKDDEVIYTYATALKKVDENDQPLAGATFAANGLTVAGSKGNYTVTSYDSDSTEQGTVMETDDNGELVIMGIPSDVTLIVYEVAAPAGYNKLLDPISLPAQEIGEAVTVTSTTVYYDADGKVTEEVTETSTTTIKYNANLEAKAYSVVNQKGTLLPSTGGIGTTMFYIIGGVLVLGAVVVLITRRRMGTEE